MSLTDSKVAMMLPISDPDRAQKYYSQQLGLHYEGTNEEGSLLYALAGGAQLMLLERPDETPLGRRGGSASRTTTCRGSRPRTTSPRWGPRRRPGCSTRTATSSACTSSRSDAFRQVTVGRVTVSR